MNTTLSVISGESLIRNLIWLIVLGVVFWLLNWLINYVGLPEFAKVAKVILAIAAVIVLISVLMSMAGHPLAMFNR